MLINVIDNCTIISIAITTLFNYLIFKTIVNVSVIELQTINKQLLL